MTGDQPDGGKMFFHTVQENLPGYEQFNTIQIIYCIPNGVQGPNHPHQGQQFSGDTRIAYLPDSPEGREVMALLVRAFEAKLIFTIGKSATTKKDDTVLWSDIEHKTQKIGGQDL